MNSKIDFTLYNAVKAKFSAENNTLVFIALTSENVDRLVAKTFTKETYSDVFNLINECWESKKPYAAFNRLGGKEYSFYYVCADFHQSEDCLKNKVQRFDVDPFRHMDIDIEQVKEDLKKLGQMLKSGTKAS